MSTWSAPNQGVSSEGSIDTAWMNVNNNGRHAMGLSVTKEFKDVSATCVSPEVVARLGAKGAAPRKTAGGRTHVTGSDMGAACMPKATRPAQSQESQKTMANTRWVKGAGF